MKIYREEVKSGAVRKNLERINPVNLRNRINRARREERIVSLALIRDSIKIVTSSLNDFVKHFVVECRLSLLQRNSISPAEREKYRPRSTPDPQHEHLLGKKLKKEQDKDIGHVSIQD